MQQTGCIDIIPPQVITESTTIYVSVLQLQILVQVTLTCLTHAADSHTQYPRTCLSIVVAPGTAFVVLNMLVHQPMQECLNPICMFKPHLNV